MWLILSQNIQEQFQVLRDPSALELITSKAWYIMLDIFQVTNDFLFDIINPV